MPIIVADTSALALAAEAGLLDLLLELYDRLMVPSIVVDELVEADVIDALMAGGLDERIEIVEVEPDERPTVTLLAEEIAAASHNPRAEAHLGEAESLTLLLRHGISAVGLLCEDEAALRVGEGRGIPVVALSRLVAEHLGPSRVAKLRERPWRHEPDEKPPATRSTRSRVAPPPPPAPPVVVEEAAPERARPAPAPRPSVTLSDESARTVSRLVNLGIGESAEEVVRRAIRALGAALLEE